MRAFRAGSTRERTKLSMKTLGLSYRVPCDRIGHEFFPKRCSSSTKGKGHGKVDDGHGRRKPYPTPKKRKKGKKGKGKRVPVVERRGRSGERYSVYSV